MQRKAARENSFILIFEKICKNDETAEEIFKKATDDRGLEVDEYVKTVFFGSFEKIEEIDALIEKNSMKWSKTRISCVSRAILVLATYEIMFIEDIPVKVSINEAIELAKKYDDDKSYSFVNGVLNAVAKEISNEQ